MDTLTRLDLTSRWIHELVSPLPTTQTLRTSKELVLYASTCAPEVARSWVTGRAFAVRDSPP